MIPTSYFLILSALLFTIGVIGVLTRRNGITMFMAIELMVNAVNLTFIAYARQYHSLHGLIFVFFIMAIAAAEAAVGLAIFIVLYRQRETIDVDDANLMHW
ncbi:MAG: NADH-quinone oxidoreductase subunit NuoK [Thermoanaerobaculia bacterium]